MSRKMIIGSFVLVLILMSNIYYPSFASQEKYPQLVISGYKRWLYSKFDVAPVKNYDLALDDRFFQGGSSGPWTEQLELYIAGQLSKDLSIDYALRQNPIAMDRYDVSLNYLNYSLIFGYPQEYFSNQELILQDYVNGMSIGGKWDKLRAVLLYGPYPSGRLVSLTENFSDYKIFRNPRYNGEKIFSYRKDNPYLEYWSLDLGRVDIVEEAVEVFLDNEKLIRNADFYVDSVNGLVLVASSFKDARIAKVNFLLNGGESKEMTFDFKKDAQRRAFLSPDFRIIDGSETITVDGFRLERDLDYRANYNLGLFIMNEPLHEDAEVRIGYNYSYGANLYAHELISAQSGTIFTLSHKNIVYDSERVVKNEQALSKGTDYLMNYTSGIISFIIPLTSSDTTEVSYSYTGIRQEVMGANAEYKLSDWSKIGSSVVSISPSKKDEWLYDEISPSSFLIWNLYNKTMLNKETFINAEFSLSNRDVDFRNSNTIEADSALKVFGKTRLGNVEFSGTYRKTGLNFASVRKVKSISGWREEKIDTAAKYLISNNFSLRGGIESTIKQEGSLSSPEVNMMVASYGLNYKSFDLFEVKYRYRNKKEEIRSQNFNARQISQSLYFNLDLNRVLPVTRSFSDDSKFIYKFLGTLEKNTIISPVVPVSSDKQIMQSELGWFTAFKGGFSSYIQYKLEDERDDASSSTLDRFTPLYRVSYRWSFGEGHDLELYYDYSTPQQRGATSYNKADQSCGWVWKWLIENPVLSEFQFGGVVKTTDYTDINDSANNYTASEVGFQGTLVF